MTSWQLAVKCGTYAENLHQISHDDKRICSFREMTTHVTNQQSNRLKWSQQQKRSEIKLHQSVAVIELHQSVAVIKLHQSVAVIELHQSVAVIKLHQSVAVIKLVRCQRITHASTFTAAEWHTIVIITSIIN